MPKLMAATSLVQLLCLSMKKNYRSFQICLCHAIKYTNERKDFMIYTVNSTDVAFGVLYVYWLSLVVKKVYQPYFFPLCGRQNTEEIQTTSFLTINEIPVTSIIPIEEPHIIQFLLFSHLYNNVVFWNIWCVTLLKKINILRKERIS